MPINIAQLNKDRKFETYSAWKSAVKKMDAKASFTGDKDIDSAFAKGKYDADWDGAVGEIRMTNSLLDITAKTKNNTISDIERYMKPKVNKTVAGLVSVIHPVSGVVDGGTFLVQLESVKDKDVAAVQPAVVHAAKKLGASYKLSEQDEQANITIWTIQF